MSASTSLLLLVSTTVIVLLCICVPSYALPFSCRWSAPDGTTYDLSSLHKTSGDYTGSDGVWEYTLNFCGVSHAGTGCTDREAGMCQLDRQTKMVSQAFGFYGQAPQPEFRLLDSANPKGGVILEFTNGDKCGGMVPKTRVVTLRVSCAGTTDSTFQVNPDTGQCSYTIPFQATAGCPISGDDKSGLSGGSVFLIIALVSVTVYIGVGCLYKAKRLGTTGVESCPHIAFWKEIPGLVMDGLRFVKGKICGPKTEAFQQL